MATQVKIPGEHAQGLHPEAVRAAQAALIPDEELAVLAETFSALADATRMRILFALMSGELCVHDLAVVAGVSESAVSQHLGLLKDLRWVRSRRDGRLVYYTLDDHHVRAILETELDHIRNR